jgi:hypothetical protein
MRLPVSEGNQTGSDMGNVGFTSEMTKGRKSSCRDEVERISAQEVKGRIRKGYWRTRLYTKEVGYLGQRVLESAIARLQTGMAKNKTIRMTIIHSENFLFFIADSLPSRSNNNRQAF